MGSKKPKLNVALDETLDNQLDSYCKLVNRNRSTVIRSLIANLPRDAETSPASTSSHQSKESSNLLNDALFQTRILRFLLIAKTKLANTTLEKEAYELWQN
ncbi:MAG: hypothetical protein EOM50_21160, partial [Erysipelotrichia bacterium]|nr:hypothetical protein [Erysipelotrichia bacterium]